MTGSRRGGAPIERNGDARTIPTSLAGKLTRIAARLGSMVETGRRPDRRRITEAELLGALRTALVEEGIWLQQTITSHERRDDLTMVTIDFTWIDGETGETLGPTTFIGYGSGPGDGAEARSLAAAERNFIRHALLLGSDDAWLLDAHPGRDPDGRRSAGVPALGLD